MPVQIAVIDYEAGNLKSVANALVAVGAKPIVTRNPKEILQADKVLLPGVGAFAHCMDNLTKFGLVDCVKQCLEQKIFLGICVGMQILLESSQEFGPTQGLGFFKGEVSLFKSNDLKIPHMGWNQVCFQQKENPLFKGIEDASDFYFVHSYYVPLNTSAKIIATCDYACSFAAAIHKKNVFATQFHPEKSQAKGLRVLENFSKL